MYLLIKIKLLMLSLSKTNLRKQIKTDLKKINWKVKHHRSRVENVFNSLVFHAIMCINISIIYKITEQSKII